MSVAATTSPERRRQALSHRPRGSCFGEPGLARRALDVAARAGCASSSSKASPDPLLARVKDTAEALTSAEADALCGASYGKSSPRRVDRRNGYPGARLGRERQLDRSRRPAKFREVPALQPEPLVELDPEAGELGHAGGRLGGQRAGRSGPAEAAAGPLRVGGVERRIVVAGDRGGDATLREVADRVVERPLREQEHVGLLGGAERRVEPGHARAHDDDVTCPARLRRIARFVPDCGSAPVCDCQSLTYRPSLPGGTGSPRCNRLAAPAVEEA